MSRSDTILVFMMILFVISYASIGTTPAVACLIQCSIYHLKTGTKNFDESTAHLLKFTIYFVGSLT